MSYVTGLIPDPETVVSRLRDESTKIGRGGSVMGATDVGQQLREKRSDSHRKTKIGVGGESNVEKIQYDRYSLALYLKYCIVPQSLYFFCTSNCASSPSQTFGISTTQHDEVPKTSNSTERAQLSRFQVPHIKRFRMMKHPQILWN